VLAGEVAARRADRRWRLRGSAVPTPTPRRDDTLIKALVRAYRWRRRIECGQAKSITDLAEQEGVTDAFVCRLLPLTCLAPDIVEAILDGRQPKGLRLVEMLGNVSMRWEEQRGSWDLAHPTLGIDRLRVSWSSTVGRGRPGIWAEQECSVDPCACRHLRLPGTSQRAALGTSCQ
jgi:hypothetical protein